MTANSVDSIKKKYHSPKLLVYGDIRELTQGGGTNQNWDGVDQRVTTSNPCGFGKPNTPGCT